MGSIHAVNIENYIRNDIAAMQIGHRELVNNTLMNFAILCCTYTTVQRYCYTTLECTKITIIMGSIVAIALYNL